MSKLTDLINEISSEMGLSRMTNDEYRSISHKLLEVRIEVRSLEKVVEQAQAVKAGTTFSATPYSGYNSDVVV